MLFDSYCELNSTVSFVFNDGFQKVLVYDQKQAISPRFLPLGFLSGRRKVAGRCVKNDSC